MSTDYEVRASRFAQALDLVSLTTNIGAGLHGSNHKFKIVLPLSLNWTPSLRTVYCYFYGNPILLPSAFAVGLHLETQFPPANC